MTHKGLLVWVYYSESGQDGLSVLPQGVRRLILCGEGIPEIFDASEEYPAVKLVKGKYNSVKAVPVCAEGKWTMFGGAFVATSDSRFNEAIKNLIGHDFYGAIPLHDRVES